MTFEFLRLFNAHRLQHNTFHRSSIFALFERFTAQRITSTNHDELDHQCDNGNFEVVDLVGVLRHSSVNRPLVNNDGYL